MRLISALTGIAFVTSIAMASSAFAQSDCTKTVPPSPFGKDDQTGASNRITPAVTKAAAAEIKDGKVTSLTNDLVDGVPLFGSRFTKSVLTAGGVSPGGALGKNELTYMEDTWLSQSHVGTHLDGMGHIGIEDCYYNQNADGKIRQPERPEEARARAPEDLRHARRVIDLVRSSRRPAS